MFGSVLSKLLPAVGDDAARAIGKTATGTLDNLLPTATKTATKPAASPEKLVSVAKKYLDKAVPDEAAPIAGQGGLFGDDAPAPAPAAPKKAAAKKAEPVADKSPRKISVLKINDNNVSDHVPVNVKQYLPDLPDGMEQVFTPKSTSARPRVQRSPRREALQLQAMERSLPDPQEVRSMTDEQLRSMIPTWRTALANILAVSSVADQQ